MQQRMSDRMILHYQGETAEKRVSSSADSETHPSARIVDSATLVNTPVGSCAMEHAASTIAAKTRLLATGGCNARVKSSILSLCSEFGVDCSTAAGCLLAQIASRHWQTQTTGSGV